MPSAGWRLWRGFRAGEAAAAPPDAEGSHPHSAIIDEALASYRQTSGRDFPPE
jgi:hypothetical protein